MLVNRIVFQIKPRLLFIKSGVWVLLDNGVTPLTMLIITPIVYTYLGERLYALWALSLAIIALSPLITLGTSSAIIKAVSKGGENDEHGARRIILITILIAFSIIVFIGLMLFISSIYIAHAFLNKMGESEQVLLAVRFGIVLLVIQGMDDVLTGAFYGGQKFSRNAKIELSLKLLLAAVVCVVAYLYRSLTIIFSIMVVFSIIKLLIKISSLDSFVKKDFLLSITNEDINSIRLLLDFSKWQFLLNLGSIVFSSADKILIASIFGSAELARYNICSLLSQYIFSLSRSFLSIIFPIVSSKVSRGYALKSFLTMHKLLVLSFICIIPFIIVTPLASFILSLWMGEEFSENNSILFVLLLLAFLPLAFNIPAHFVLLGLGRVKLVAITSLIGSILTLLVVFLSIDMGLFSFVLGKFVYTLVGFILFISIARQLNPYN